MGFRIKLGKHVSVGKTGVRIGGHVAPGVYMSTGKSGTYTGASAGPIRYNHFDRATGAHHQSHHGDTATEQLPTVETPAYRQTPGGADSQPPSTTPPAGGPSKPDGNSVLTWVILSVIGLIVAIMGATTGGFWGFVGWGLIWFGLCLVWSAVFKKTHWLRGLSRALVGGIAAAVLILGGSIGAVAAPSTAQNAASPHTSEATSSVSATAAKTRNTAPSPTPTVVTKTEQTTEPVGFGTQDVNDPTLSQGQTAVQTPGMNGVRTHTYQVTYINGVETGRTEISNQVTQQPVAQVVAHGTKVIPAPAPPQPVQAPAQNCPSGTYVNSAGNTICRPTAANVAPQGATAKCGDGTFSYSQSRRGTCSSHGGVAAWL